MAAAPTVVSLTFTDGLSSQYRNAAPLLQKHGMDGTFYVASNWVRTNDPTYMRVHQLDELYRQGMAEARNRVSTLEIESG